MYTHAKVSIYDTVVHLVRDSNVFHLVFTFFRGFPESEKNLSHRRRKRTLGVFIDVDVKLPYTYTKYICMYNTVVQNDAIGQL